MIVLSTAFLRTLVLYLAIIVALRIMGKRQVGEMQPTELVITILISELAAIPMQDFGIPLLSGLIPVFTLISAEILLSWCELKWRPVRRLLNGNPMVIIEHGKLLEQKLKEMRLSIDEVMEQLRIHNISDPSKVRFALVETNGQLSFVLEPAAMPATAQMLSLSPGPVGVPVVLISDGRLLSHNLNRMGRDRQWLTQQLKEQKIRRIRDVFLMTLDECGHIFLQKKEGAG